MRTKGVNEMNTLRVLGLTLVLGLSCATSSSMSGVFASSIDSVEVPAIKVTPLKLYLSSVDAFDILEQDSDILFIDVRDPVEIAQTGHPAAIDAIVPTKIHSDQYDADLGEYVLKDNPAFVPMMDEMIAQFGKSKHDKIIITCGSGWRSAEAVRKLSKAGYTNVWHIVDGYDGETKPGRNSKNAWKLAGLPWSKSKVPGGEWIMMFAD